MNATNAVPLPVSLTDNPQLADWIRFDECQKVTLYTGKVEIGQGIGIALMQIAAEELGLTIAQVQLVAGSTVNTPDEGWTSASISIEVGGSAVRLVCAEIVHLFRVKAAEKLQISETELKQIDGVFYYIEKGEGFSYWQLSQEIDLHVPYRGLGNPKNQSEYQLVGESIPRQDILEKLSGPAFIHDFSLPSMLHGRIVRPPHHKCRLESIDEKALASLPGIHRVVRDGSFVGLVAEQEIAVVKALKKASQFIRWSVIDLPAQAPLPQWLISRPSEANVVFEKQQNLPLEAPIQRLRVEYSRPFIAHASIGPCCALAQWQDNQCQVWSHTQGVFPLRANLAKVFNVSQSAISVIHKDGAGCYGHNGADDVALDAALLAKVCHQAVRVVWSREDELTSAPFGAGMLVQLDVSFESDSGKVTEWKSDIYSMTHLTRPGWGDGVNLLAASHLETPLTASEIADPPLEPFGGGAVRNGIPLYDIANQTITHHLIKDDCIRTSALRSLGAHANVFAIESILDEIAQTCGQDPVQLRLAQLADPRAVATIKKAAEMAGWQAGQEGEGDWGRGIGFGQYKNKSAYMAAVVEVNIDEEIRIKKVYAAVDAGLVINPDGVLNQVEGGIVQAISWTLKEQVNWSHEGFECASWEDYPILGFDEIPDIQVCLIHQSGQPAKGVGECAAGPIAAAIANAVSHALGARIRDLPLTPEKILSALV